MTRSRAVFLLLAAVAAASCAGAQRGGSPGEPTSAAPEAGIREGDVTAEPAGPEGVPRPQDGPRVVDGIACYLALSAPVAAVGEPMRMKITLVNTGAKAVRFPPMNDPKAWHFHFTRPQGAAGSGIGCAGTVEIGEDISREDPLLEPGKECSFWVVLPGKWGGWSHYSVRPDGGRRAASVMFPAPGEHSVRAVYAPFHAARPELRETPGWGMRTQGVTLSIR